MASQITTPDGLTWTLTQDECDCDQPCDCFDPSTCATCGHTITVGQPYWAEIVDYGLEVHNTCNPANAQH